MTFANPKPDRLTGCRPVAWSIIITVVALAADPGRAQTLQPSAAELFVTECRIVQDAGCACVSGRGQPEMSYTQLVTVFSEESAQPANVHDVLLRQIVWRRQCGILTETDTAP